MSNRSCSMACLIEKQSERHVFVVCRGETCELAGSAELLEDLLRRREAMRSEKDVRIGASAGCIGHCAAAPAMVEDGRILRWVSPRRLKGEFRRLGIE